MSAQLMQQAMRDAGLQPAEQIIADGIFRRISKVLGNQTFPAGYLHLDNYVHSKILKCCKNKTL